MKSAHFETTGIGHLVDSLLCEYREAEQKELLTNQKSLFAYYICRLTERLFPPLLAKLSELSNEEISAFVDMLLQQARYKRRFAFIPTVYIFSLGCERYSERFGQYVPLISGAVALSWLVLDIQKKLRKFGYCNIPFDAIRECAVDPNKFIEK